MYSGKQSGLDFVKRHTDRIKKLPIEDALDLIDVLQKLAQSDVLDPDYAVGVAGGIAKLFDRRQTA